MNSNLSNSRYNLSYLPNAEKRNLSEAGRKILEMFYFSKPMPSKEEHSRWGFLRSQEGASYEETKADREADLSRGINVINRLEVLMSNKYDAKVIEEAVLLLWELARLECNFCSTEGEICGICYEYFTSDPIWLLSKQNLENTLVEETD